MLSQLPNIVPSPPLWQLIRWVADPISFQINCSYRCGDVFTMRLAGLGPFVIIDNPQAIQEIFSQDAQFDVGRANELAKPLIGENSLMLLDGERHRKE